VALLVDGPAADRGGARRGSSPAGRLTTSELAALVEDGLIDTVVAAFTDMQGRFVGKRVSARFFLDEVATRGFHFCNYLLGTDVEMGCPPGFERMGWEQGYGDWRAVPDLSTLRAIPWLEGTAFAICDVVDEHDGPVAIAPREMLRAQVARAAALGFRALMGSELEFYLLRETYEGARRKGFHGLEPYGWFFEDYQILQGTKAEPLYRQVRRGLEAAGVPVEFSKGEAGAGQHEINLRYAGALEAADRHAILKHALKELALQNGLAVTFMAKPDHGWTGSSCHIHCSLHAPRSPEHRGAPVFPDPADADGLSQTMRAFLGGQVACGRAFCLLLAPTVNSYKRYASASWAPVNLAWGRDNRTCGLRVVGSGAGLRVENRLAGADANPYLAFAAVLAAGLHGIRARCAAPPPFRGNAYEAEGLPRVPGSLPEAVSLFAGSPAARDAFGAEAVRHYAQAGRVEQAAFDRVVTCWERERYLERI
jgi:glutamine synthetase